MIKDEQDEIITIRMSSFARYFRYMGGCCAIFPYMVILVLFIFVNMAVTYYI